MRSLCHSFSLIPHLDPYLIFHTQFLFPSLTHTRRLSSLYSTLSLPLCDSPCPLLSHSHHTTIPSYSFPSLTLPSASLSTGCQPKHRPSYKADKNQNPPLPSLPKSVGATTFQNNTIRKIYLQIMFRQKGICLTWFLYNISQKRKTNAEK